MSPISSTNISLPIGLYPWLKYGDDSNTTTLPFLTAGKLFQILFASNCAKSSSVAIKKYII